MFEVPQRRFDGVGELDGIGRRLLLHTDDDGRHAAVSGVTALHGGSEPDIGHLFQQDGSAVLPGYGHALQVFDTAGAANVADEEFTAVEVDEATSRIPRKASKGLLDLRQCHPELRHARGIRLHPQLTYFAADRDDLRHPWNRQKSWAQHEVRVLTGLHGCRCGGLTIACCQRQCDEHDFAHDGRHRSHDGRNASGELLPHQCQALRHELAVAVDVRPPIELGIEDGQAHAGRGAHARDPRHAVERGLQREGHQLLDFFGCHTSCFRQDGDQGFVEVGKHIDRRAPCGDGPVDHQQRRDRQDEQAVVKAVPYDPIEHCVGSVQRICAISGAPCTTTRLSAPRPCVTTTVAASRDRYCTGWGM